jgi:hypothetical protein
MVMSRPPAPEWLAALAGVSLAGSVTGTLAE